MKIIKSNSLWFLACIATVAIGMAAQVNGVFNKVTANGPVQVGGPITGTYLNFVNLTSPMPSTWTFDYSTPATSIQSMLPASNGLSVGTGPVVLGNQVALLGGTLTSSNISLGVGAGGGSATIAGTDFNHKITITMGSTPTSGNLYTLTFTADRGHVTYPVFVMGTNAGSIPTVVVISSSSTNYVISLGGSVTPGDIYSFNVICP